MTQNQGSEPVPASRTGQLISARDMAMQKFEEGMRLISEASELCGLSLFTSRIMQPNAFGLPSSLDRTIEEGRKEIDRKTWKRLFEETGIVVKLGLVGLAFYLLLGSTIDWSSWKTYAAMLILGAFL